MSQVSSQVWLKQIQDLLVAVQQKLGFSDQVLEKNSQDIIQQIFALTQVYAVVKKSPDQRDAILAQAEGATDLNQLIQQISEGLPPEQADEAFQEACLDVFTAFFGQKFAKISPQDQDSLQHLVKMKLAEYTAS